jgi:hypothetical protein
MTFLTLSVDERQSANLNGRTTNIEEIQQISHRWIYKLGCFEVTKLIIQLFGKGKAIPMQGLDRPLGLQEVETLAIFKQSAIRIGRLYPQGIVLVHISVKRARTMGRTEGLSWCKIPNFPSGIESKTFWSKPTALPRKIIIIIIIIIIIVFVVIRTSVVVGVWNTVSVP